MLSELHADIKGVLYVLSVTQTIVYQDEEIKRAIGKLQEDEREEDCKEAGEMFMSF